MKREDFSHLECPLARVLEGLGEWWTMLVVRDLFYGIDTFEALCRDLGIARNILVDRLRKLEAHEVVERRLYQAKPKRYRYRLTPKGLDLFPVILAMIAWSERWESPEGAVIQFIHGTDGHVVTPELRCRVCNQPISLGDVRVQVGPGVQHPEALPLPLRPPKNENHGD